MTRTERKVIRAKVGLLELAKQLGNVTQATTVQHGKVWIFGVAEHWNAEFLGWHVTKRGTRFEAIQPLAMAVRQQFGHLSAGAARGPALRHDHGNNFMAAPSRPSTSSATPSATSPPATTPNG